MNVNIQVIPHEQQRYPTVGDWWYDENGDLQIRVSKMSDWRHEMLVVYHELRECLHCKHDGVSQESVDWFDKGYEAARTAIKPEDNTEPGDAKEAPYCKQHAAAMRDEEQLAKDLGVDWNKYADEIEAFP